MPSLEVQAGVQPPAPTLRLCGAGCSGGGPGPPKNKLTDKRRILVLLLNLFITLLQLVDSFTGPIYRSFQSILGGALSASRSPMEMSWSPSRPPAPPSGPLQEPEVQGGHGNSPLVGAREPARGTPGDNGHRFWKPGAALAPSFSQSPNPKIKLDPRPLPTLSPHPISAIIPRTAPSAGYQSRDEPHMVRTPA